MAEKQMRDLSKKVKANLIAKVREGGYPMRAPLGYKVVDGSLVIVPKEAELVQRIYDLYDSPATSLISISKTLETEQILPPRGLKAWHKQTIDKILKNPVYISQIRWKGKIYPGSHEPIIEERQYNSVQAKINTRTGTRISRKFNLSGMLRLSDSGRLLSGETAKRHVYYGAHLERNGKRLYLREDRALTEIKKEIKTFAWTKEFSASVIEIAKEIVRDERDLVEPAIDTAQKALSELRGKQHRLLELLLSGQITQDMFGAKNTEITLQISDKERNLRSLKADDQTFIATMADIADKLHRLPAIIQSSTNADACKIMHEIIDTILISADKTLTLQFKEPFRRFAHPRKVLNWSPMRPVRHPPVNPSGR